MKEQTFLQGAPISHILGMAWTSMVGLVAVLMVDALDLFFLSLLGDVEIIAALGFAWPVILFILALSLGFSTTMMALVARAVGAGRRPRARRLAFNILLFGLILNSLLCLVLWLFTPEIMALFGAEGRVLDLAIGYLRIILLCLPIVTISMAAGALLRAIGAKKRAMAAKLSGAFSNAILDPIFIFAMGWGIEGAAWATVLSRLFILAIALHGAVSVHNMVGRSGWRGFRLDLKPILGNAIPISLAKAGPPIGSAFVISAMAAYGTEAMAAMAVIDRITPFAFVGLAALPQAIGPIVGQNFGAGQTERIRAVWQQVLGLMIVYMLIVALVMALGRDWLAILFGASGEAAALIGFFCIWIVPLYFFTGVQYVAHTSFNVTGKAPMATAFDLARETLGVIPFVWLGSHLWGAEGILIGLGCGMALFGLLSGTVSYRIAVQPPQPKSRILAHGHG
ncbi:MATE family efflux transporter [Aestuariispira insulae]|uniref:Putative MATE family efflux protein n=1 Tax=Aestuariispira insulae TaxID=1461337 RepID=A0A3D9HGM9_9PROT|nr:MATE family efflux transporter [Aestuariispira insulae]RED48648.1 putative MATE family efflux protein [Aestuariispira insulae]